MQPKVDPYIAIVARQRALLKKIMRENAERLMKLQAPSIAVYEKLLDPADKTISNTMRLTVANQVLDRTGLHARTAVELFQLNPDGSSASGAVPTITVRFMNPDGTIAGGHDAKQPTTIDVKQLPSGFTRGDGTPI